MQYEQTFNAIDNILRNEAGCSTELDYIEQTSWLLFLKYLNDLEQEQEMKAMLSGKEYKPIITGYMRWSQWAAPKKADVGIGTYNGAIRRIGVLHDFSACDHHNEIFCGPWFRRSQADSLYTDCKGVF